jgi:hypothetical protein
MESRNSLFPTFFISGFECSTFRWKDRQRRDLVAETQHDRHVFEDYALLRSLGIGAAREGVPWPMIDIGGRCDFSRMDPYIAALNRNGVLPIWDLCHYGYPDDLDPYSPEFTERFASYARQAAEYLIPRNPGPHFFTPINEITFWGFMGGEWGWAAPYGASRDEREALRLALCKADIAAVNAIRSVDPRARMLHVDPLVLIAAPKDRPDLKAAAEAETEHDTFAAWDIIGGISRPELGGSPEILDIVGVNCYSFGQMEYRESGPHAALPPGDDRVRPLCDLLVKVWERYRRPVVVAETSGLHDGRADWLRDVTHEALAAVLAGVDLHALCLFPAVDMPDWHTGGWVHNGICDLLEAPGGELRRVPVPSYVDELRRWQREFHRVTTLDADPLDQPVRLADIQAAAERLRPEPDKDWH